MMLELADGIAVSIPALLYLGFVVGTLSGFFGVGGAFIMTPALNLLGFPMVMAIGTDLALMVGSSIVATLRHLRFGHVDVRLGLTMVLGTALGVWCGKRAVFALAAAGDIEMQLRLTYVALLFGLAAFMARDYYAFARRARRGSLTAAEPVGSVLSRRLQALRIPPYVHLPMSGIGRISVWVPLGVGLATGFLAALLGVGGGFIRMPALIYAVGVPTATAVGTDLFEIVFTSAFGGFLYALEGQVQLTEAMLMLLSATLGVELGSFATRRVRGVRLRYYFALTVFGAGVSVALRQAAAWLAAPALATAAVYLLVGVASAMVLVILLQLARSSGPGARPKGTE